MKFAKDMTFKSFYNQLLKEAGRNRSSGGKELKPSADTAGGSGISSGRNKGDSGLNPKGGVRGEHGGPNTRGEKGGSRDAGEVSATNRAAELGLGFGAAVNALNAEYKGEIQKNIYAGEYVEIDDDLFGQLIKIGKRINARTNIDKNYEHAGYLNAVYDSLSNEEKIIRRNIYEKSTNSIQWIVGKKVAKCDIGKILNGLFSVFGLSDGDVRKKYINKITNPIIQKYVDKLIEGYILFNNENVCVEELKVRLDGKSPSVKHKCITNVIDNMDHYQHAIPSKDMGSKQAIYDLEAKVKVTTLDDDLNYIFGEFPQWTSYKQILKGKDRVGKLKSFAAYLQTHSSESGIRPK